MGGYRQEGRLMKKLELGLLIVVLLLGISLANAQPWLEEFKEWDTQPSFEEIQDAFERYWDGREIQKGSGWKQFKRWEWFMENRLDENGNFDSEALWNGWQEKQLNFPESSLELNEAAWVPYGPFNPNTDYYVGGVGRVNCITFHPTNSDIMWAGAASGGCWKTVNGGGSWTPLTDNLPVLGVSSIVVDPNDTDIIYLATGDTDGSDTYSIGVLKSSDGGLTWDTTDISWTIGQNNLISKMIMHPINSNIIVASTHNGIYRTINGGDDWAQVFNGGTFKDLEVNQTNPDIWYAARNNTGVYRSTDGGVNWSPVNNGLPGNPPGRIAIAIGESNPDVVYALYGAGNSSFYGVYRTDNGGDSWVLGANSPNLLGYDVNGNDNSGQAWYDLCIVVDPTDAATVYLGGVNIWRSTNSGVNWEIFGHWTGNGGYYIHADQHFLDFNGDVLFSGNDGGIHKLVPGANDWIDVSYGLQISQIYRLGTYTGGNDVSWIINGYQDNGTKLMYEDSVWTPMIGGDGMECAIDPVNPDYMYGEIYYGSMYRTTNGTDGPSSNWNGIGPGGGRWVSPFVLHPTISGILYLGANFIQKSTNHGSSWTGVNGIDNCRAMAISPTDPEIVYGITSNSIAVTMNGGTTWDTYSLPANGSYVAVNPLNPANVFVTISGFSLFQKVYMSNNYGENWTNISGTLPNLPANCITVHPLDPNHLYVGMDIGVFHSSDLGETWEDYSTDLPNVIVNEMEIHAASNKLIAATYGRGTWITPAEEVSVDPTLSLLSPNEEVAYIVGQNLDISWSGYNIGEEVKIEINRDYPDGSWDVLYETTPNDYIESWLVSTPTSENARIRISSISLDPVLMDTSDVNFRIVEPSLTITSPNGGEVWTAGFRKFITWDSANLPGNLILQVKYNYPDGEWITMHPDMTNSGSQAWVVNGQDSENVRLRIYSIELGENVDDISDDNFAISSDPAIDIIYPNGGEIWHYGEEKTIRWQDNIDTGVDVNLYYENSLIQTLAEDIESNLVQVIVSEDTPARSTYLIEIRSTDSDDPIDFSDQFFTITTDAPELLLPENEAEVPNIPVSFSWNPVPGAEYYMIEISETADFAEEDIVVTQSDIQSENVNITDLDVGTYFWRVSSVPDNVELMNASEIREFSLISSYINEQFNGIPTEFALEEIYPNPFNASTSVVVALPENSDLEVKIFNIMGELVSTICEGTHSAGYHSFSFDASGIASGVYFARVQVRGKLNVTRKFVLVR
jgi:photosystem II stability/assembly factor-like uncharacterized protein